MANIFRNHEISVHNEKKFVCQHCGKSFGWKGAMHFHEKSVHLKMTEFKCDQCDKSFSTKGNLRKHVSVCHSEERPYSCDKVARQKKLRPWTRFVPELFFSVQSTPRGYIVLEQNVFSEF